MSPIIRSLKVKGHFRFLWLKSVTGVSLSVHCAGCLKGTYDSRINPTVSYVEDLEPVEAKAYYLCGVSKPYKWSKNLHVAFVYAEDESFEVKENGIVMMVDNARRIQITDEAMNRSASKHLGNAQYNTCRNWQFAHMFSELDHISDPKERDDHE